MTTTTRPSLADLAPSWERRPTAMPGPQALMSDAELFDGLVALRRALTADAAVTLRYYGDHGLHHADVVDRLLRGDDRDLAGWVARTRDEIGERSFALVANDFQRFSPPLWSRLVAALLPLYRRVGVPRATAVALFAGDYALTPFGVHIDLDSTLYFVLHGRKRIHLWEPDYAARVGAPWYASRSTGSTRFREYLGDAVTLEGGPGDLLYWPAGWWHIAESDPGLDVAISVGVPRPGDSLEIEAARAAIAGGPAMLPFDARLPGPVDTARLAREREHLYLRRRSALGFQSMPPRLPWRDVEPGDRLRAIESAVQVARTGDGALVCAAAGDLFAVPDHPSVSGLLAELGAGGRFVAAELIARHAGDRVSPDGLLALLGRLVTTRAVAVEP